MNLKNEFIIYYVIINVILDNIFFYFLYQFIYSKLIKCLIITISYLNRSTKNIEDNKKYFRQKKYIDNINIYREYESFLSS